jgi:ketosteroid isomerase-like protein
VKTPNDPELTDFGRMVEQFQHALNEFFKGNPEPAKVLMSHRDDVTLGNPFGPFARGWQMVSQVMDRAGLNYREGAATGFEVVAEHAGSELAYTVWVERFRAKVGSSQEISAGALRRTTIYRREDGAWRVVHSQADAITTARPAESVIEP